MQQPAHPLEPLAVTRAEAGQKLLNFLVRRFRIPVSLAHRWIRSGQVRLNGGRSKPFARVAEGDLVRVPPAAFAQTHKAVAASLPDSLPPILFQNADLLVLAKPAGLAVHPGSGHADSIATRLARRCPEAAFQPTPAHRLDKETSGVLLVAQSYACLRSLHESFRTGGAIRKEYLAWVAGRWPGNPGQAVTLRDEMQNDKAARGRMERMALAQTGETGREALARATLLRLADPPGLGPISLLRVELLTGRTHQIRLQLSSRGHPVLGDKKYGSRAAPPLRLHCCLMRLPDGQTFRCPPDWNSPFAITARDLSSDAGPQP